MAAPSCAAAVPTVVRMAIRIFPNMPALHDHLSLLVDRDSLFAVDIGEVFGTFCGGEFLRSEALSAIHWAVDRTVAAARRHGPHIELLAVHTLHFEQMESHLGPLSE